MAYTGEVDVDVLGGHSEKAARISKSLSAKLLKEVE
jgi:hypothetical protein